MSHAVSSIQSTGTSTKIHQQPGFTCIVQRENSQISFTKIYKGYPVMQAINDDAMLFSATQGSLCSWVSAMRHHQYSLHC